MASRFGNSGFFLYEPAGTVTVGNGTFVFLDQSQMPQYPFEEYRISDVTSKRNLNGQLFTYRNYNKQGFVFRWDYLDDACAGELRNMFDANPTFVFSGDGVTYFGTFRLAEQPSITESQYLLFDIEMRAEEV